MDQSSAQESILCSHCAKWDFQEFFTVDEKDFHAKHPNRNLAFGTETWDWRWLRNILENKDNCSFCRLIAQVVLSDFPNGVIPPDDLINAVVRYKPVFFRSYTDKNGNDCLVNRLSVELNIGFDRLGSKHTLQCFLPAQEGQDGCEMPGRQLFTGRRITNQIDFNQLQTWIKMCDVHGQDCAPVLLHSAKHHCMKVIDVEAMMVIQANLPCRYAALSYVWGQDVPQLKLTEGTYSRLTTKGGLGPHWDDIPSTIMDAITLCRKLSIPYLWVDALCLQQDNPKDLEQFDMMSEIYSGAYITIVNAAGYNSWSSLPGVRSDSRTVAQCVETVQDDHPRLQIGTTQSTLESILARSPWMTRAWTFQESVLSRRLLIFADDHAFYQCNRAIWWEDAHSEVDNPKLSQVSTRDSRWYLYSDRADKTTLPPTVGTDLFQMYAQFIELYTQRNMTNQGDAVRALTGILNALSVPLQTEFFHGLPLRYFDHALLFNTQLSSFPESRRIDFPSWSWVGWILNKVTLHKRRNSPRGFYYPIGPSMMECLEPAVIWYRLDSVIDGLPRFTAIMTEELEARGTAVPDIDISTYPMPEGLTESELGRLLVCDTRSVDLVVSSDGPAARVTLFKGNSIIRTGEKDSDIRSYTIECPKRPHRPSTVKLCSKWRETQGSTLRFVGCSWSSTEFTNNGLMGWSELCLHGFIVSTDARGISYRVQTCAIDKDCLGSLSPESRRVYML